LLIGKKTKQEEAHISYYTAQDQSALREKFPI